MTPEQLAALKSEYAQKSADVERVANDLKSTGAQLLAAEKVYEGLPALQAQIEEGEKSVGVRARLQSGAKSAAGFLTSPVAQAPTPAGSAGVFAANYKANGVQFDPAGHADVSRTAKGLVLDDEVGPGVFGPQKWEMIKSFEYKKDFNAYLRKGMAYAEGYGQKTLMEARDDQGGIFAPADMLQRVLGRSPAPTQLRGLVQSITTGRDSVEIPRKLYSADDKYTTNFRANWTGESPADGTGAQAAIDDNRIFGSWRIPVHTAMLNGALSKNLLDDAAYPIQSWLEGELGETADLLYEDVIVNADGVGKPTGILFGAAATNNGTTVRPDLPEVISSGVDGALSYDFLTSLQMALAPQYENDYTRWVMEKRTTLQAIAKLKDANNRPLFTQGAGDYGIVGAVGKNRRVLDDQVVLSSFMPTLATGAYPIIYGDLRGYMLVNRLALSIQVLYETKAKLNMIEIVARLRFGGQTVEPYRLKIGRTAA